MNENPKNRNLCAKQSWRATVCLLLLGGTAMFGGCEVLFPLIGGPSISDGELLGIDGWDVQAFINVEPNQGPEGTPIGITVSFSRGASNVARIDIEDRGGEECNILARTWRGVATKVNESRWESSSGQWYLTGNSGILRFVAMNAAGTRIAIGDIQVNDGCSASSNARQVTPDEGESSEAVLMTKEP